MTRLAILLATTLLTGCMASRPMPVVVEVADARTGDPLPGVIVRAAGGTFYIPTLQPSALGAPGATFGPLPDPEGAAGETDAQGRAYMTVSGQRPVSLRFFKPGYPEGHLTVTTGEQQGSGCHDLDDGTGHSRRRSLGPPGRRGGSIPHGQATSDDVSGCCT